MQQQHLTTQLPTTGGVGSKDCQKTMSTPAEHRVPPGHEHQSTEDVQWNVPTHNAHSAMLSSKLHHPPPQGFTPIHPLLQATDHMEEHPMRYQPARPSPLVNEEPPRAHGHGHGKTPPSEEEHRGHFIHLGRASPLPGEPRSHLGRSSPFSEETRGNFVNLGRASPLPGDHRHHGRCSPQSLVSSGRSSPLAYRILSKASSYEDLEEVTVMVLYTGGTIGMRRQEVKGGDFGRS